MQRPYTTFLGVDLGGGKGKTTAVARLSLVDGELQVSEIMSQSPGREPWYDEALLAYLSQHAQGAALAIDAPLTLTACIRCVREVCPGSAACEDPAVVWFRTQGAELAARAAPAERDRIAEVPAGRPVRLRIAPPTKPRITPYTQRACEVVMHLEHGITPREALGQGSGPLTARAAHLRRALKQSGFTLNTNLLEVFPKATITALFGASKPRGYKRRAGTWEARAQLLEALDLGFAPSSRLAREQCLQSDHCFDALVCAYTAYLWARDGWELPAEDREVFAEDGWIWSPAGR